MRKLLLLLVCALLALMCMAAPALASASFVTFTSSEVWAGPPNVTSVTPCGNGVLRVTMANHFHDVDATHPWGNADVHTYTTLIVHTVDGQWIFANTSGQAVGEGPWGVQEGSFTGWVSFATGETYFRFAGKGVSGDAAGTLWKGSGYCPGMGDPVTQMTTRVLIP
jgi:hypothetical protein